MQIVIDIPEKDWEFLKESDGCRWSRAIIDGVINGTPLPKGHGRLIDADALAYELKHFGEICLDEAMTIIEADKESEVQDGKKDNQKVGL